MGCKLIKISEVCISLPLPAINPTLFEIMGLQFPELVELLMTGLCFLFSHYNRQVTNRHRVFNTFSRVWAHQCLYTLDNLQWPPWLCSRCPTPWTWPSYCGWSNSSPSCDHPWTLVVRWRSSRGQDGTLACLASEKRSGRRVWKFCKGCRQ